MKKTLPFLSVLFMGTVATSNVKAQEPLFTICIQDSYGYAWNLTVKHNLQRYNSEGTVDVGAGFLWDALVKYNGDNGNITLWAINPQADGCGSGYVDSFKLSGTASGHGQGGVKYFNGSGTWKNYCSNAILNSGKWTAIDCAHASGGIDPNGPATYPTTPVIKVSPNPISSSAKIFILLQNRVM